MKLEFRWVFSRKILKYQILWRCAQWGPRCFCMRTDRHDEANSRFPQFCERA